MFFGHLPAGYLCSNFLLKYREIPAGKRNTFLAIGLIVYVFTKNCRLSRAGSASK